MLEEKFGDDPLVIIVISASDDAYGSSVFWTL